MEIKKVLAIGIKSFTPFDIVEKAAQYKNLKSLGSYSDSIKIYTLNDKLLVFLAKQGIKRQDRSDCNNKIFTLVDENHQEKAYGFVPSNYWNFDFDLLKDNNKNGKFDLRVTLRVRFEINIQERGIVFWPMVCGPFVSASSKLSNYRLFKALVENDKDALAIAKELAVSDGNIIITWTDIGFGGLRKVPDLFAEFAGQNEAIKQISEKLTLFYPPPKGSELFIAETDQPIIFQAWRSQLNEYLVKLSV